jgi:hypothetical protein
MNKRQKENLNIMKFIKITNIIILKQKLIMIYKTIKKILKYKAIYHKILLNKYNKINNNKCQNLQFLLSINLKILYKMIKINKIIFKFKLLMI